MLNKTEGDLGYAAIKLDMSKAYDRVEWSFLRDMMRKLGFAEQWIKLIMECVTTVRWQHIRCKPTNLCKLENYQSGPLDADPIDRVRGLKHKKRPTGGGLKRKKIPPLTPSIKSASSGPDW